MTGFVEQKGSVQMTKKRIHPSNRLLKRFWFALALGVAATGSLGVTADPDPGDGGQQAGPASPLALSLSFKQTLWRDLFGLQIDDDSAMLAFTASSSSAPNQIVPMVLSNGMWDGEPIGTVTILFDQPVAGITSNTTDFTYNQDDPPTPMIGSVTPSLNTVAIQFVSDGNKTHYLAGFCVSIEFEWISPITESPGAFRVYMPFAQFANADDSISAAAYATGSTPTESMDGHQPAVDLSPYDFDVNCFNNYLSQLDRNRIIYEGAVQSCKDQIEWDYVGGYGSAGGGVAAGMGVLICLITGPPGWTVGGCIIVGGMVGGAVGGAVGVVEGNEACLNEALNALNTADDLAFVDLKDCDDDLD